MVTLLILPALLDPHEYGLVQLTITVALLINFVVPLEITQGLARYYPMADADTRMGLSSSAWWFTLAGAVLILLIGQVFSDDLQKLLIDDPSLNTAFRISIVFVALNAVYYFLQNQFRWIFDLRGFVVVSVVFALGTAGLTLGLGSGLDSALVGALIGQVGGMGIATVVGLLLLRPYLFGPSRYPALKQMLQFSLPLVPAQIALFISQYFGRFALGDTAGLQDVGLLTLASQMAGTTALLLVGVQAALTPLIMTHFERPETPGQLARLFELSVAGALVLSGGLALFAPEAIGLLRKPEYDGAAPLVLVIAPAALLGQFYIFSPGFAIARRSDRQLLVSLAAAAIGLVANFVLVANFGLWGAAWATLASTATFIIAWFTFSLPLYPLPIRWGPVTAAIGAYIAVATVAYARLEYGDLAIKLVLLTAMIAALRAFGLVQPGTLQKARNLLRGATRRAT